MRMILSVIGITTLCAGCVGESDAVLDWESYKANATRVFDGRDAQVGP